MHDADCAHVAGAEAHDGKARNQRLDGAIDRAAPADRPDLEAAGNNDSDFPNVVWPTISTSQSSNSPWLRSIVTEPMPVSIFVRLLNPAALDANLAHRGRNLQRLPARARGRGEFDGR